MTLVYTFIIYYLCIRISFINNLNPAEKAADAKLKRSEQSSREQMAIGLIRNFFGAKT